MLVLCVYRKKQSFIFIRKKRRGDVNKMRQNTMEHLNNVVPHVFSKYTSYLVVYTNTFFQWRNREEDMSRPSDAFVTLFKILLSFRPRLYNMNESFYAYSKYWKQMTFGG